MSARLNSRPGMRRVASLAIAGPIAAVAFLMPAHLAGQTPAAAPARDVHQRHRADSPAQLPELPSPGLARADVAADL